MTKQFGVVFAQWLVQRDAATRDLMDSLDVLAEKAPAESAAAFFSLAEFTLALADLRNKVLLAIDTAYPPPTQEEVDAGWDDELGLPSKPPKIVN